MRTIGLPKSNDEISDYLRNYPVPQGIQTEFGEEDSRFFYTIDSEIEVLEERHFLDAASDLLSTFYKTRTILKEVKNLDFDRPEVLAYIGTLSAFERGDEKRKIAAAIRDDRWVNLDGIYNFRLDKTVDGWSELGRLAEKLLKECLSTEDVQELVAFMLGMSNVEGAVKLLHNGGNPKIERSGKLYPVARITGNPDCDLVFSLLKEAPKSIVVPEPERFSEGVLSAIRALGE